MNLNALKKFAQGARRTLISEIGARLDYLTTHDDPYIRAHKVELDEIQRQVQSKGRERVVDEVAYTWFNRLVALRFMDLRGYTPVRVVSPQVGQVQPELLFQIKQGRTPAAVQSLQRVFDGYLHGTIQTDQPDREIYTAALLGICNEYSRTLPFLFRKVDEYMAVLLPTDLLSENSLIAEIQRAIGEEEVEDVEVIGWLYQFYISERKDQVFGRPKGEKIKKEDIPAATQLFTPHWIVRYMVENSLGRLWRNNRPETALRERMEYYIEGDPEPEFLTISGPEQITLLDPACGSGHILTYAFDLLYGMYEEAGYSVEEIPSLVITNNLYGIDIDTRAAELASFALTMKAREKDRFFFKRGVVPNVLAMEDVTVDLRTAGVRMSPQLQEAFGYLSEATNFGSLIPVPAEVQGEIEELLAELNAKSDADLFADQAIGRVRAGLRQLRYLAQRYHCVVTNPPYMSTSNANQRLKDLVSREYEEGKADLFAAFIVMGLRIARKRGYLAMITQHSWMFLSRYQDLRLAILSGTSFVNMTHLGPRAFETIGGEVVQTTSFILRNNPLSGGRSIGLFIRLVEDFPTAQSKEEGFFKVEPYSVPQSLFLAIPNHPFVYWISRSLAEKWENGQTVGERIKTREGLTTGDNERFLRYWFEVSAKDVHWSKSVPKKFTSRWYKYLKGGSSRRWYGNLDYVVDWHDDGRNQRTNIDPITGRVRSHNYNGDFGFRAGVTWSGISGGPPCFRYVPAGFMFDAKSPMAFAETEDTVSLLTQLNSIVASKALELIAPTLDFKLGHIESVPDVSPHSNWRSTQVGKELISIAKADWDSRESSWDFQRSPLVTDYSEPSDDIEIDECLSTIVWPASNDRNRRLSDALRLYTERWHRLFVQVQELETESNNIFLSLYDLLGEIDPAVRYSSITILEDETDLEARENGEVVFNINEIVRQFVSYGVGCIFGRYSLDKDGLVLANAGDDLDAYLTRIPEPSLRPDESGILPITDDNDFSDDLPSQWRVFFRAAFGDDHYDENLRFLEDGLGKRLRPYFLKGFYEDHVKRYKNRPIYWLITSPKGTLQALIYLHRYNRDTVNRFLNDYLRRYQEKLQAKRVIAELVLTGGGSSQSEKTKAQKRIDDIRKALEELSTWERDVVRPLAEKRIELDLDDGVKVNYGRLGAILAKVKGLNG